MVIENTNTLTEGQVNFRAAFESLPGVHVLLDTDAPRYTILNVTDDHFFISGKKREEIIGLGLFEAFPPHSGDQGISGIQNLSASFEFVIDNKSTHQLPVQRYDLKNEKGLFEERYWSVKNKPVPDEKGDVLYIILSCTDITIQEQGGRMQKRLKGIEKAYNFFLQIPSVIILYKGDENIIELANDAALFLVNKNLNVVGKPLETGIPELNREGYSEILNQVRNSGKSLVKNEMPVSIPGDQQREIRYFDVVFQPIFEPGNTKASGVFTISHDVTELVLSRRKLEMAKKEAEKQKRLYETINGATPDLIYVFDLNARFTYANNALLNMWGKTAEEALGKSLLENGYEPWHATMHEKEIEKVIHTRQSTRGVVAFPHATEGDRIYDYILVPVFNNKGEVEAIAGTTRDITQLKEKEKELRESHQRFEAAIEAIHGVLWTNTAEGQMIGEQKSWTELTGQSYDEYQGYGWSKAVHHDDAQPTIDAWTEAVQERKPFVFQHRLKTKSGEWKFFSIRAIPILNEDNSIREWVGIHTDITSQKLQEEIIKTSEAQLQIKVAERTAELESQNNLLDNILANSSNGISVTEMIRNNQGKIVDATTILANDSALRLTGLPREVYLGKTASELDPEIMSSPYGQICLKTLETGEPSLIQYFLDHTQRWLELTISKMDEDHLIHIFTDVTQIKESQIQLERTVEELKRSNQNLEEFAYAASHDLKEPIRKIHFFAERLKTTLSERMTEEEKRFFDRMELASRRMSSLVDDLLSYSQVSLRPKIFEEVDLNKLLNRVLEDLDLEIESRNAMVQIETLGSVNGHQFQLQQTFHNLVINALKYSQPGISPRIYISSETVLGKDLGLVVNGDEIKRNFHVIRIKDNGIGFEQSDADRIFNVFTRLHGNTEFRGTGIGLSIVRKVMENHNGFVRAEGSPRQGATFTLIFPEN